MKIHSLRSRLLREKGFSQVLEGECVVSKKYSTLSSTRDSARGKPMALFSVFCLYQCTGKCGCQNWISARFGGQCVVIDEEVLHLELHKGF